MSNNTDAELSWEDQYFRNIFNSVCKVVKDRKKFDEDFTKEELGRQLEDMCVLEGQDYGGRGRVGDLNIEASVAALQYLYKEWGKY